jgi:hypothetical protein
MSAAADLDWSALRGACARDGVVKLPGGRAPAIRSATPRS